MANGHGQIELHAVFACNDDMAIGVRSAIRTVIEGGHSFSAVTQIVGYDGISEIREYIDAKDPYIAGTVDVRVEDQARAAMLLIHRLVRSGERRNEAELIAPRAVKRAGL